MPINNDRVKILFQRFAENSCSKKELQELYGLISQTSDEKIFEWMDTRYQNLSIGTNADKVDWDYMFQQITKKKISAPIKKLVWRRVAVAASIILMLGVGSYLLFFNKPKNEIAKIETQEQRFKNDVDPGKYKAKLTLADGKTIVLDSAQLGELTKQGSTVVLNKNGQLVYDARAQAGTEILYNTLATAKGETYATVLADGSKVWLNSASSIKFPVAFVGNKRTVEITGEAYFEVTKDATKPFTVSVNGMNVQVLGTHFNINAYGDEATIKTTLLEGSVKVVKGNKNIIIKPGEQANLKANGELSIVSNADLDEVMAWKNGLFKFKDVTIEPLMRQIERWYDVEVVFEGKVTEHFITTIPRDVPVSQVFKYLETTGRVHFKIDGRKVTVMP